jgi:hypothetical protein
MQIVIPKEVESIIRQRAAEAGFDDVERYALHRLLEGETDTQAVALLSAMLAQSANRHRIEEMIEAGYASGPPTDMTKDDWNGLRELATRP